MAAFLKFNNFVENIAEKIIDLENDTLMVLLTNTSPNAADTHVDTVETPCKVEGTSNAVEVAAGNGYTKKGNQAVVSASSQAAGVYKLVLADPTTWTAGPAAMAPFRYAVLFSDTGGAGATRPVIGWWDYGSEITLGIGETFDVDFDAGTGVLTIT